MLIPIEHVKQICRIGDGADCCSFLLASGKGFECAKTPGMEKLFGILILRRGMNHMTALGDNCEGYAMIQTAKLIDSSVKP